ncbi:MAG: phosphodiesterase [Clostridiales bacterium]|nr:phosphodiesterase [Clostridiales bacterium]
MKLFIATDLHGSAFYTERVIDKFNKSNADMLILLGDVYNHGPRNPLPKDYAPMKVAEMLNAISAKVMSVQGNCDSDVDQMISKFPIVPHNIIPLGKRRLFLTHGHIYNKHSLPMVSQGDVVVYGHFHVNDCTVVDGVYCINVSSASLPKDTSAYCIIDEQGATIYDFDDKVILTQQFN